MINTPTHSPDHPDRSLHAEEAIERGFEALATRAEHAGWSRDETAFALLNLAVARILTIDANMATEEAIGLAAQAVHGR